MRNILICSIHPNIGCSLVNLYVAFKTQNKYDKVIIHNSFKLDYNTFFKYFNFDFSCIKNLQFDLKLNYKEMQRTYRMKVIHQDINYSYIIRDNTQFDLIFEPSFKHSKEDYSKFFNNHIYVNFCNTKPHLDKIYSTRYKCGIYMQVFNNKCLEKFLSDKTYSLDFFNCIIGLKDKCYIDIDNMCVLNKFYSRFSDNNVTLDRILDYDYKNSYSDYILQENMFYMKTKDYKKSTENLITQYLLSSLVVNNCEKKLVTKTTFPNYVLPNIKLYNS